MNYRELQAALKTFRANGTELQVKLNASKADLEAEYDRVQALELSTIEVAPLTTEERNVTEQVRDMLESVYAIPSNDEIEAMTPIKRKNPKFNGLILHRGVSAIDNVTPIVVIATGMKTKTANRKTGDMIQTWILVDGQHPQEALNTGTDSAICGNCPHRKQADGTRSCYVNPMSFGSVYKAYLKGNYPTFDPALHLQYFIGRAIRFGSYGDPINMPYNLVNLLASVCTNHTGYTHQWRDERFSHYADVFQASVDNLIEFLDAKDAGWGTFRVKPIGDETKGDREVTCQGGIKTTCTICSLCSGTDKRPSHVSITAHGGGAKYVS